MKIPKVKKTLDPSGSLIYTRGAVTGYFVPPEASHGLPASSFILLPECKLRIHEANNLAADLISIAAKLKQAHQMQKAPDAEAPGAVVK